MIFLANSINDFKDRHVNFVKTFREGFKIVFDASQIGQTGIHEVDTWTLYDKDDSIFLFMDMELEGKSFPLYFEVREDDFVRENRIQKWPNLYTNENDC
jgi:hypothetical protein